jgi:murein DD-endopeptidase MepM/ murein hydrolase activator NlpD
MLTSLTSAAGSDRTLILPPLSTTLVMTLDGIDLAVAREKLRRDWRFTSFFGDPARIVPDAAYPYRLPFRTGHSYRLVQGFDGDLSHQSEASRFALDFQLEVGEPVHAAREGVVVRAVDWFCRAGGRELIDQTNMVVVGHADGTMAHYVHLDHGGVLVREGDRIARGQQIGTVGMTGFTGGPHLHFVVMRERDIAIPVAFAGYEGADLSRPGRFRVR